ncbi:hypothetical protein I131_09970 [Enterococcus faecium CRL1879]|nr:hypothetical protein I131_09970 [Enterococcus faecium CRL1879]
MSNLLSKEQANLIVSKLMADIPYNINIMNEQGFIIASGEKNVLANVIGVQRKQ